MGKAGGKVVVGDGEHRGGGEREGKDRPSPPLGSSASLVPSFQPSFSASFPSVSNNGVNPLVRIPALRAHAFLFTVTYCLLFKNSNHQGSLPIIPGGLFPPVI